mgnify:CR=1 FL=1
MIFDAMNFLIRRLGFWFLAFCGAGMLMGPSHAQTWPAKPIRFIVASQPGGIADLTPRLLAPKLQEALGQPIVIENRPGGGIVGGGETVAKGFGYHRTTDDGATLEHQNFFALLCKQISEIASSRPSPYYGYHGFRCNVGFK